MKNRFKGNYIKIITKLVDTSKFPAILCSIDCNANNLFQFPKIVHCNKLFEKTFNKISSNAIEKDFDSLVNFDFLENEYIKFIKKIKNFERIMVKVKTTINQELKYFAISFHPLVFMSTFDKKYCLIDYIPINDLRDNPEDIYDILENVNDRFSVPLPTEETANSVNRILKNESFLKDIYETIERSVNIVRTLNIIVAKVADYLKANRVIIYIYNSKSTIRHFAEYSDKNLLRLLDAKNEKDRKHYISFINKIVKKKQGLLDKLNVLFIRETDESSKIADIQDILCKFKIKSQMIVEDEVRNNIFVRICLHQCYSDKEWQQDEIELVNRIVERLSLVIEKNVTLYKLGITNKKLIEKQAELEEALTKEKELRKIQTEFIAMVSHQFRTPLQIIESTRGLLKRKLNSFETITEDEKDSAEPLLDKIKTAVFRMDTLINKTLDLSNIETTGDINYFPVDVNLKKIIMECIDRVIPNNNEVVIKEDLTNLPLTFFGDGKLLEHAFGNIIENAVKYSKKGGIVEINTTKNDNIFTVSIKDYGVGIPKEDQKKLFQKFVRAKNVQTMHGTGIGLFLVKKFIERHNGEIKVESEENKGTTFFLSFPINKNKEVVKI
jgi:signal transduction histidine kinase